VGERRADAGWMVAGDRQEDGGCTADGRMAGLDAGRAGRRVDSGWTAGGPREDGRWTAGGRQLDGGWTEGGRTAGVR